MRTMVDAMQKDRRLIGGLHSEYTNASMQLASQICHDLGGKFSNALWTLHQLLDWFVLISLSRHSDISSEVFLDIIRENPKAGHRIMSWILQISEHFAKRVDMHCCLRRDGGGRVDCLWSPWEDVLS